MKYRFVHILILLLGIAFSADAQRSRKPKKAKSTAAKKITRKQPAKTTKLKRTATNDSLIKGTTIEITQSYKPEIKPVTKRESIPVLPPVDTATAKVSMHVPSQSLNFIYHSLPLRPLALAKDTGVRRYKSYLKAGGGNLSTVLIDAGTSILQGKNYETAVRIHHLSQAGSIVAQKTSFTGLDADAIYTGSSFIWHAAININYNQYYYYGFNDRSALMPISNKQAFTGINICVDMERKENGQKLVYHPEIKAAYLADNNNTIENKASATIPFFYTIDTSLKLRFGLAGAYSSLFHSVLPATRNSNMAQLLVGADYHKGAFRLNAGLYPTIGQNNSYLLPDVKAAFTINGTQFTVFAGWMGHLARNTYEQMILLNPYTSGLYNLQQTHADEIYGGLQTNIGNHITVNGKVSWWQYDNMALPVNDTMADIKRFLLVYDKVNALSLQGSVRYQIGTVFAAGFSALYTSYNTTTSRRAWHQPGLQMTADVLVRPMPDLIITAYLSVLDEIYALDMGNKAVKLNSAFDCGLGAEYTFMPRLSAFVNVNNIFNNQYERWYGYRVYGFNIFGGVRLKF